MKVLLLGGGAREHALAWKLRQSPSLQALICAPGNPGMAALAECVPLRVEVAADVVQLARTRGVDLVVVGPEAPLVAGVGDALRAAGVDVFGPDAGAARIEGSKAFAKEIMAAARVPTARAEVFDDVDAAAARALTWGPVVVKADGLAGGKGVVVADSGLEAAAACRALGAKRLVLEERLSGPELSLIALCDGQRFVMLAPSQDHKRLLDGDLGPNTGGMGAYAPARLLDDAGLHSLAAEVIGPTLRELARRGTPFRGALYAGLMLTPQGPRVLEFNARLGDPETQVLLHQLDEDLLPLLVACARGTLVERPLRQRSGVSVTVVLAAEGYPASPVLGAPIQGLEGVDGLVFHAGTRRAGHVLEVAGGRVVSVCGSGPTIAAARERAYATVEQITFRGRQFRRDIGAGAVTER